MQKPTAMMRVKVMYLNTTADIGITKTGLALLHYRATHGGLPETTDALEAENISDPIGNGSLIHQYRGTGFELHSLGPDEKDNGSIAKQPKTGDRLQHRVAFLRPVVWHDRADGASPKNNGARTIKARAPFRINRAALRPATTYGAAGAT